MLTFPDLPLKTHRVTEPNPRDASLRVCLSVSATLLNSLISIANQAQNPLTNTTETLEQQCVCCLSDVMFRLRGRGASKEVCVCVCFQRKGVKQDIALE